MKRTLHTLAVMAPVSLVLAGCLGNTTQTVDVEIPRSAYNHLYPDAVARNVQAAPTVAVPRSNNADVVSVTVPTAPVRATAPAPVARVQPAAVRAAPPALAPARAAAPVAAPRPAPAPAPTPAPAAAPADTCGAGQFQGLVGGPVQNALDANLPSLTRFYGSGEAIDPRVTPARVNLVLSTADPAQALTNGGTVTRVFCG